VHRTGFLFLNADVTTAVGRGCQFLVTAKVPALIQKNNSIKYISMVALFAIFKNIILAIKKIP